MRTKLPGSNYPILALLIPFVFITISIKLIWSALLPLNIKSSAASVCTASISISPATAQFMPGERFNINVLADTGSKNLTAAMLTINYDSSKIEIYGASTQPDNTRILDNYPMDERLSNELSGIFEFPAEGKINMLASCKIGVFGNCSPKVNSSGGPLNLASIPIQIKPDAQPGPILFSIQHTSCANPSNQSVILEDTGSPIAFGDILDTVESPNLTIAGSSTVNDPADGTPLPTGPDQTCDKCGKCENQPAPPDWQDCQTCRSKNQTWTSIGCVPSNAAGFIQISLKFIFSIGGGLAFLSLLYGGFLLLSSKGSAEQIQSGKTYVLGAVLGIALIYLSVFVLRLIGVEILSLPGFG